MNTRFAWLLAVTLYLIIALCLPASAGVNQVFALKFLRENTAHQSTPQSPGELTICGRWVYADRNSDNVSAKHCMVWVYTDTNPWLAYGYTNDQGQFIIGPFTNPNVKIKVKVFAYSWPVYGSDITVTPLGGDSWDDAYVYSTHTNYGEGFGPFSDGTRFVPSLEGLCIVPVDYEPKRAWWIQNDLYDGFQFLPDKIGNYFVEWPWIPPDPDWTGHFCPCGSIPGICSQLGHIYLKQYEADGSGGRDTVLHEMGHAVM